VYGENNREPSEGEAKRITQWAKSRGGIYPARFANLSDSERRLAEYIDRECGGYDDEEIEYYAQAWDNFGGDAEEWIDYLGCAAYQEADVFSDAGLDIDEVKRLPEPVRDYVMNNPAYTSEVRELLRIGLLATAMFDKGRGPRPGPRVPEGQRRLPFEERVFERTPPPRPPEPKWPRGFDSDDYWSLAEAKQWVDFGWDDKDDFDDAVEWWSNWFSPEEAWIFQNDMAQYDKIANGVRSSYGLPLPVAIELRDRGIDALDVQDATRRVLGRINIRDADSVAQAVEQSRSRVEANKRRRSSRRR
jgi:hypothetical protein